MSETTVEEVKRYLRISASQDDTLLQELIDNAEDEALGFLDMTAIPVYDSPDSSEANAIGRAFRAAVCVLVQGAYDELDPAKFKLYRDRAEALLMPYRQNLGV